MLINIILPKSLGHLKTGFKFNYKNVPVPILKLLPKPLIRSTKTLTIFTHCVFEVSL